MIFPYYMLPSFFFLFVNEKKFHAFQNTRLGNFVRMQGKLHKIYLTVDMFP